MLASGGGALVCTRLAGPQPGLAHQVSDQADAGRVSLPVELRSDASITICTASELRAELAAMLRHEQILSVQRPCPRSCAPPQEDAKFA
jgi:hypothetical protein